MFGETVGSAHRARSTNGELNHTDTENSTSHDVFKSSNFCLFIIIFMILL